MPGSSQDIQSPLSLSVECAAWTTIAQALLHLQDKDSDTGAKALIAALEQNSKSLLATIPVQVTIEIIRKTLLQNSEAGRALLTRLEDFGYVRIAAEAERGTPLSSDSSSDYLFERLRRAIVCGHGDEELAIISGAFPSIVSSPRFIKLNLEVLVRDGMVTDDALFLSQQLAASHSADEDFNRIAAELLLLSGDEKKARYYFAKAENAACCSGFPAVYLLKDEQGQEFLKTFCQTHATELGRLPSFFSPRSSEIFLHLYCTGGVSLGAALARLFLPWESRILVSGARLAAFENELRLLNYSIPYIQWHSGGGWAVPIPPERYRIFTHLRDPFRRFVSMYNAHLGQKAASLQVPPPIEQELGFDAFVRWALANGHSNHLCRSLCELELPPSTISSLNDTGLLTRTRDILQRRFFFVGSHDNFEASLTALALLMGFSRIPSWRHDFQSEKQAGSLHWGDVSPATRQQIKSGTQVDQQIYEEQRTMFEAKYKDVMDYLSARKISLQSPSPLPHY
jgi:hypothetical protein